jgi:hypothetical protein
MAWDGRIPWLNNKPVSYVGSWEAKQPGFEWRDNKVFGDTLTFVRFSRGRSAVRAVFKSETYGCNLEMFISEFEILVPHLDAGVLQGTWKFAKKGANYGLVVALPA